jgi:serine/threonine-protein kinase
VHREIAHLLADRYIVHHEIGRGGMATVVLAQDRQFHRRVAVKVIRPELAASIGIDRFLREIRLAARLSHPNIVPVLDSGEVSGLAYYVMPYIDGESLRARLDRHGPLAVEPAVEIARAVASALDHAHAQHIIHRDIKPGNILLSNGHALVTDFGVARAVGAEGHAETITAPGIVVGTPAYMSPEQASGERQLDGRSDIYSLGCVLFEMLTGDPPYDGPTTHAVIMKCFSEPVPSAQAVRRDVPDHVESAITGALAKLVEDRFDTANSFAEALTGATVVVPSRQQASIAVLPLANLEGDSDDAYLSDGLTEEIIGHLANLRTVRVAARTSAFAFRDNDAPVDAGKALGVTAVLAGAIRRSGDELHVQVRLLRVSDGTELWNETYDRELQDVFAIQEDIAQAITRTLAGKLALAELERTVRRPTDNPTAFALYLRGRYEGKSRRQAALLRGVEYFERALALDPAYALAHVGLAETYSLLAWYRFQAPHDVFPRANVAALHALRCDELLPQGHAAVAVVRFYYEWDWVGAERAVTRALALRREEPTALHAYGELLSAQGRFEEALTHAERALTIEPLAPNINASLGWIHLFRGANADAIAQFHRTIALDSTYIFGHWFLGQAYLAAGELDGACETLQMGVEETNGHPGLLAYLASARARTGRPDDARAILQDLRDRAAVQYVPSDYFAVLHLGLGEPEVALEWLTRAQRERALHTVFLGVDPMYADLRTDRRFDGILRSVGLR